MHKCNQPVLPFIIVVSDNIQSLTNFIVYFDTIKYEFSSFHKAIDVLFKIYATFGINYPIESSNIYYYMQWAIYEVHKILDEKVPAIHKALTKAKLLANKGLVQ